MARIRLEFVPVEWLALGWLGFDHLQLVFEPESDPWPVPQDDWYVLEGNFGRAEGCVTLGVAGANGCTTLAQSNGARGRALVRRIGTPETRGSVVLPVHGAAMASWQIMAAFARELDAIGHPYSSIGLILPRYPVVNSSSVVSSLLWRIGINIHDHLPAGVMFSPGTATLLGASACASLMLEAPHFDTLIGGAGDDVLAGSADTGRIERLFGGPGNDTFLWMPGQRYIHGGEPGLPAADDGFDAVDYRGAGRIELKAAARAIAARRSDYIVTFSGAREGGGTDWLTSIEALYLDPTTDTLVAGRGLTEIPRRLDIDMRARSAHDACGRADFSQASRGVTVAAVGRDAVEVKVGAGTRAWCFKGLRHLAGSPHDDHIQMSQLMRVAEGGAGDDVIDARLVMPGGASLTYGYDAEIDGGAGDDILIAGQGRTFARGGPGCDTFILPLLGTQGGEVATELVIADASPFDSLLVPAGLFRRAPGITPETRLHRLTGAADCDEGAIRYQRKGADLVIWLAQTGTSDTADAGDVQTARRAVVRVLNYRNGDLGIETAAD